VTATCHRCCCFPDQGAVRTQHWLRPCTWVSLPNKALQPTAATVFGLPGLEVSEVAAAAELGRSAWETAWKRRLKSSCDSMVVAGLFNRKVNRHRAEQNALERTTSLAEKDRCLA
jgi:hypothetical protein